jgi:hypothetical protein
MSKESGCAVPFIETSAKYNVNVTSAFAGAFADQPACLAISSLISHASYVGGRGGIGLALMEMRRLGLVDGTSARAPAKRVKQPSKCVLS